MVPFVQTYANYQIGKKKIHESIEYFPNHQWYAGSMKELRDTTGAIWW